MVKKTIMKAMLSPVAVTGFQKQSQQRLQQWMNNG